MSDKPVNDQVFEKIASELDQTYSDGIGVNRNTSDNLPRITEIIDMTDKLLALIFPGFEKLRDERPTAEVLKELHAELTGLIRRASGHYRKYVCKNDAGSCPGYGGHCPEKDCSEFATELLSTLPQIREIVKKDIDAAYAGDPAAKNCDEIAMSYPGLKAITVQRLAHILYQKNVPLIPRMMTEYAHSETGIDINPGALLGEGIFIDHGTGVVIGETAVLGNNIRIYQGVTLGAVHFPKDACGMLIKNNKRHPTIGNNVTIYSGASVLGDIVIGDNSVIGGNVWLTESLPPGTKITARPPEHKLKTVTKQD